MARLIASFFGSGLLLRKVRGEDGGSGTIASFAALGVSLLIDPWWGRAMAMLAAVGFGWWAVTSLPIAGEDPGWVVIDEAAGTFLATIGLGVPGAVAGLVIFRAADIAKRLFPGVRQAERLPGATGVMADDLVAGLYGLAAGWLVQALIG